MVLRIGAGRIEMEDVVADRPDEGSGMGQRPHPGSRRARCGAGIVGRVVTTPAVEIPVGERAVRISNPDRVYFPATGATKLDVVNYYLAVGPGIVNALRQRPCMLHRFPKGVAEKKVHQKRVPAGAPPWLETVRI